MAPDAEMLVLGGGPAGAAAAIALARAGRRVMVVEREPRPREKVCGEFLGADAAHLLDRLGLDIAGLGAVPVPRAGIAHGTLLTRIALPFPAWGLPRRVLDEALLQQAIACGATVLRGAVARRAAREGVAWAARLADGRTLRAPRLLLATGKHDLRGHARRGAAGAVGMKLHLWLRRAAEDVLLLPFPGGYAGLQPSGDGLANLCAALRPEAARLVAHDAGTLLAMAASGSVIGASLLREAMPVQPRPIAVAGVPYGFLHRDGPGADPALYRLGDQFAVIPSFCGDGIAMALAGGLRAAEAILAGQDAPAFHREWRRDLARPMRWAGLAAWCLGHLPTVFTAAARAGPLARLVAQETRVRGLRAPVRPVSA